MHREILDTLTRCPRCGMADAVAVLVWETDDAGEPRAVARGERLPHSEAECERFQALERETWPTLW